VIISCAENLELVASSTKQTAQGDVGLYPHLSACRLSSLSIGNRQFFYNP